MLQQQDASTIKYFYKKLDKATQTKGVRITVQIVN